MMNLTQKFTDIVSKRDNVTESFISEDMLQTLYESNGIGGGDLNYIMEKLITLGGKAYPKFNNVLILAGGSGSGKGFALSNIIGIEGKTFDVDALKELAVKTPKFVQRVKDETGRDITQLSMKVPEDVSMLHQIIGDIFKTNVKQQYAMFNSILAAEPNRKPNLIFDVTLKNLKKLDEISSNVSAVGYDPKNIHIVWVITDIEVAKKQNKTRSRNVPDEILINTHRGVSMTMRDIIKMDERLQKYMDGDIFIAFSTKDVDTTYKTSDFGGAYFEKTNYIKVKSQGKKIKTKEIEQAIIDKIARYVPDGELWNDIN